MKSHPTLDKELIDTLDNFPGSNRLLFGTNSKKKIEPKLVKKMILISWQLRS
jgi:hypothetical protein